MERYILNYRGLLHMLITIVAAALIGWLISSLLPAYSRQLLGILAVATSFAIGVIWGVNGGDILFVIIIAVGFGLANAISRGIVAPRLVVSGLIVVIILLGYLFGRSLLK